MKCNRSKAEEYSRDMRGPELVRARLEELFRNTLFNRYARSLRLRRRIGSVKMHSLTSIKPGFLHALIQANKQLLHTWQTHSTKPKTISHLTQDPGDPLG